MDAQGSQETAATLSRRGFLAAGAAGAGALVIAAYLPGLSRAADAPAAAAKVLAPNAYVRVGSDGWVTIVVSFVEMGQGIYTSVPMLIAEELDVELYQVRIEHAPADEARYGHPLYGLQVTGGSASIQAAWKGLRQCGATARSMLVSAAAQAWGVAASECTTDRGRVLHPASGRSLTYGELAARAAALPVPQDVPLKDPRQFKLVGRSAHRLDTPSKVDGTAVFGIDVRIPGMKVAAVAMCPYIGGRLKSVDDARARRVAGYLRTLRIENGVAVVAEHYGAARKALSLLSIVWDEGPNRRFSNKVWGEQLAAALKHRGQVTHQEGDVEGALATSRRHEAVYEAPPLAHTAMEPLNATIHVRKDACDVWVGTQAQARTQRLVAEAVGLPAGKVVVHNHLVGGGFGRKLDADYVAVIAKFARQVGYPLKVVYSREEDIRNDAFRPYFRHELAAALDASGALVSFRHRLSGSAVIARYAPSWLSNGVDGDVVHTAELPYKVPAKLVEFVRHEPPDGLMTGNWRGVGPTHNAYVNECFIDELAVLAKKDPIAYRKDMLSGNTRALAVLNLAAQKAGWGTPMAPGKGRGVALIDSWGSYGVLIMELTVAPSGEVSVDRMVSALDCGLAVNPDGVVSQMEGGIAYGLSAALFGAVTFEGGRVLQSNFHDYQPLRMHHTPDIEVHLIKSPEPPGGVGEMGTALVTPAFLNAIHAATGKRFRNYPVSTDQLRSS
jgi:isoquinoline 1-oxidoreductase beta subunit